MNKVILVGRLTSDPEIKYTQGKDSKAISVVKISIAVSRKYKKENEPTADFINCVAFGNVGEFIEKYFKKGKPIGIAGAIRSNSWTDIDGTKRYSTNVVIEEANFVGSKESSESEICDEEEDKLPY